MLNFRNRELCGVLLAVFVGFATPLSAQTDSSVDAVCTGAFVTEPAAGNPIPLRDPAPGESAELWENVGMGGCSVRNVVDPTLTPVLPETGKATGAAVIVAPGGGFLMLAVQHEGYDVAQWLAQKGIAAFVLKYRTRATPVDPKGYQGMTAELMADINSKKPILATPEALQDAMAAVRLVRSRSEEWSVDADRVGFVGFSAGAITALGVGLQADDSSRPDFIAPIYPPMEPQKVPAYAPPMFLAIALDDPLFAIKSDLGLINAWRQAGIPLEVHLYERGGHGFGMSGKTAAAALWIDQFYVWMKDSGFLAKAESVVQANAKGYSVANTTIGEYLAHPATKAILLKHLPMIANSDQINMMSSQTLVGLQMYTPDQITAQVLDAIQADLNALPAPTP